METSQFLSESISSFNSTVDISDFYNSLDKYFEINKIEQQNIIENLHTEMDKGLANATSSLIMMPSFVCPPNGHETGKYLVLDLGGTNFRVMSVDLKGEKIIAEPRIDKNVIKKEILSGAKDDLFDYLSEAVAEFISKHDIDTTDELKLGFTFSFPIVQTSLNSGKLLTWTKEFCISGVEGEDVVLLLNQALKKKGINVVAATLMNDTVGTLAHGKYLEDTCDIGVILGTGTNASYIEDTSKITKCGLAAGYKEDKMIINTEWGNFDKLPRSDFDVLLDSRTKNCGNYVMEKMVSAKYLGELTKLVVNEFIQKNIFSKNMENWKSIQFLDTADISEFLSDDSTPLDIINQKLINFNIQNSNINDRLLLKNISKIILNRSAKIAATLIVGIIQKNDPKLQNFHTVAIDGSLYEKAFSYKERLLECIQELLASNSQKIKVVLSKDGSGIGAAVATASST